MRQARTPFAALAGVLLLWHVAGASADEPLKIRHGWVSLANLLSPVLFENKAILRHYGQSYTVEPTHFAGTSTEVTAIAAGDVDIITLGFSTFASAIENAGLDLRIVADGFQDGAEGHLSSPYLVRNDSGIKTVEDLKGKILASNAIGGALDVAARVMLRQHHLEDKKDYTLIETQFPTMTAMLTQRKVDLIAGSPPFIYDPKLAAIAHPLFRMTDAVERSQMIVFAMRADFLRKNRPALEDFFEDMLRGIHWFLDPAHRGAALDIVAAATKLPVERYAGYLYTREDYYHAPDGRPDLAALQHDMATQRQFGFLKSDLEVSKYTDLSLIESAARRLR